MTIDSIVAISAVFFNEKDEVLVCKPKDADSWEFPRGMLSHGESLGECVARFCMQDLNIEVEILDLLEIFSRENITPKEAHIIVTGKILTGVLTKRVYSKVIWKKLNDLSLNDFTYYGRQVVDKIKACNYCKYIHGSKPILDEYFTNVFDKLEEVQSFIEILSTENDNSTINILVFNQILVHIRAFYIESEKRTKNITVQNYLRLYQRDDLASDFDDILNVQINSNITLKKMIRESVDKFIAHYDRPSDESLEIYQTCKDIFSFNGTLPLSELIQAFNRLFMLAVTEVWYYAGELGVSMDRLKDITGFMTSEREQVKNEIVKKLQLRNFDK